ncbi:MAG: lytic transglycosylase domain-containing protein [Sphingomicrobium sp.]
MRLRLALFSLLATCGVALAEPASPAATESVHEALCRLIESAAREHGVAADFLTNLIWRESSFRAYVVSPKGAQGIAQFMPATAAKRGLVDPFDPEQAIPQAARLIADHLAEFGNLGLAAAAYNAGAGAVAGCNCVPPYPETRAYVARILALADGAGVLLSPPLEVRLVR